MAGLENPLAYYTPGIPGRGAGTIFKTPDLSGVVDKFAKMKAVKDQKQASEEDEKAKLFDKITYIKEGGWVADTEEIDNDIKTFQEHALTKYREKDGNLTATDIAELNFEKSKIIGKMKKSDDAKLLYNSYEKTLNTNQKKYTKQGVQEAQEIINKFWNTPIEERGSIVLKLPAEFDLSEHLDKDMLPKIKATAKQIGSSVLTQNGDFINTETERYYTLESARPLLEFSMNSNENVRDAIQTSFENWATQHPDFTEEVPVTKLVNGKPVTTVEKQTAKNSTEYAMNILAPLYTYSKVTESLKPKGGINIGISAPQTAAQAGQKTAELVVKGADDSQQGFAAETYSSINAYNKSKLSGGKVASGVPIPGSYSTEKEKDIDFSYSGDMVVNDHYKVIVATENIPLTAGQAATVKRIDPTALTPDNRYLKKGAPIPTEFRNDPIFNGKKRSADFITYSIITKYDLAGNPITQRQYTVDASIPQTRNWLDVNMIEQNGKKFTEWYLGYSPIGSKNVNTKNTGTPVNKKPNKYGI